jgi:hypothetical protein
VTASFATSAALCATVLFAACGADTAVPTAASPVVQGAPPPPQAVNNLANWKADATVLSRSDGGRSTCGWGTTVGETRIAVEWRITITGDSISLEEDMRNWPTDHIAYSGTLTGTQFTANYSQGSDYLRWVCQFRGAALTGSFSANFSSFQALETLAWGPPEQETTVQRRWVGSQVF